ncbi:MAG: glycosyltransferase family 2 protein [Acidobacteria bacterium]|nr:glycosyltransferase family 2 protein [Acidobacteriota bacterium]
MSMVEFSVIIPTRDRKDELVRCLDALILQEFPRESFEVIICDDGSNTNLRPIIIEARRAGINLKYVRQEPKGPAAARNLGIRLAHGRIIAMTDSDTLPARSWLKKLHEAFTANPQAVAVEGMVHADNEGEFDPLGEGPCNKTGGVYLTCNCAYLRNVLIQAGGFDETFPYPAFEDTELAARVQQIGRIIWQPEAVVIHPQRPLTLQSIIKKLRHWEYAMLMGYRYGYLAWSQYPVRNPRLRVAALSVVALPLSKFKTAANWVTRKPTASLKLVVFGLAESIGALLLVAPKALFGYHRDKVFRRNYL